MLSFMKSHAFQNNFKMCFWRMIINYKMPISVQCRTATRCITNLPKTRKIKLYKSRFNYSTAPKESPLKKYNTVLVFGLAVTSAVVGSYLYFTPQSKKEDDIIPEEETVPEKFVDPYLDESLALLEEHGPVPYLIIGAGAASFAALRAIRVNDPTSKILIVGDEPFYPYMRPPLSKEMWLSTDPNIEKELKFKLWSGKERSLFFERDEFYCPVKELLSCKNGGMSILRGVRVVHIDPVKKSVMLDNGKTISYNKCLLATGGRPQTLPVIENATEDIKKNITSFRTIEDFKLLSQLIKKIKSVTIIGGGFLGSELACALGKRGKQTGLEVTQVFPESGNMGKVFPEYLSTLTTEKICAEGVNIIPDATIKSISKIGKKIHLKLTNGDDIDTDHVIVAVGLQPNVDLAKDAGLELDTDYGGFVVNAELEARKDLWVAGDAACFYDLRLGRRRVEHHDHAMVSGRLAGENMTGCGNPFSRQPMFWSDLGPDIGYEAIGIIDSSLPTVGVFMKTIENDIPVMEAIDEASQSKSEPQNQSLPNQINIIDSSVSRSDKNYEKGIVFYLRNNIIVGILLWNVFNKMHIARQIINEAKPNDDIIEVARLFHVHEKLEDE